VVRERAGQISCLAKIEEAVPQSVGEDSVHSGPYCIICPGVIGSTITSLLQLAGGYAIGKWADLKILDLRSAPTILWVENRIEVPEHTPGVIHFAAIAAKESHKLRLGAS